MIIECPLEDPQGNRLGIIKIKANGTFEGLFSRTTPFVKVFGDLGKAGVTNAIILKPKFIPAVPLPIPKKTQVDQECFYARFDGGIGHDITTAFALWRPSEEDVPVPICKSCLDYWLDRADDNDSLEPRALRFLDARAV